MSDHQESILSPWDAIHVRLMHSIADFGPRDLVHWWITNDHLLLNGGPPKDVIA